MFLSKSFSPYFKEDPVDAVVVSHRYSLQAGLIKMIASGIYSFLPMGTLVLKKIENIVRQEISRSGGEEIIMPCIQPSSLWSESGRYDDYGPEMLRFKDRREAELLFGPTAEEVATDLYRSFFQSYRDAPKYVYNIQWKFRDEIRPRFGLLRGREFLMKDGYSFDLDEEGARKTYSEVFKSYLAIFRRLGLVAIPVRAETGPIGGDMSHEFQILASTGESELFFDRRFLDKERMDKMSIEDTLQMYASVKELHDEMATMGKDITSSKGIEVGHIFYFGTKYSEPMNAHVQNKDGSRTALHMGSYGIGVSRLVAAIIEASHDKEGIIWPLSVCPYEVGVIHIGFKEVESEVVRILEASGTSFLYDDTDAQAAYKFSRMNMYGLPMQIIIGKTYRDSRQVQVKSRKTGESRLMSLIELEEFLTNRTVFEEFCS